jgi:hypothetical protein
MMNKLAIAATLLVSASLPWQARASVVNFNFVGPGVSGSLDLTYGTSTDSKSGGFELTGITGTFTDTNNGLNLVNVPISALVPITHDMPEATNLLAPNDFSRFAVATGLDPVSNGFLTYDNLYYPNGAPPTASDYTLSGGLLDIYGVMFDIGGGRVVDVWGNGTPTGVGPFDYGVAVANHDLALDYVGGAVSQTPEPATLGLIGGGLLGMLALRRARRKA